MRLIDADVLLNNTDGLEHVKYSQEYGHVVLVCDIVYAPTVDATEVVRCKDCIHWGSTISQADREQCASQGVDLVCNYWETDGLYAEDFCSYGERKETENG